MKRRKHVPPNLAPLCNFLTNGKVIVCGSDHIDYPNVYKCKCAKCGREVCTSRILEFIPTKLCYSCAPNITD